MDGLTRHPTGGLSTTALTTRCTTTSYRTIASFTDIDSLIHILATSGPNTDTPQLSALSSALHAISHGLAQLEQSLPAASVISERLRAAVCESLVACDAAVWTVQRQLVPLRPENVREADEGLLGRFKEAIMVYTRQFQYFEELLLLSDRRQQDESLASQSGQDILKQTEVASRLTAEPTNLLPAYTKGTDASTFKPPIREKGPIEDSADHPPPYSPSASTAPTEASPSTETTSPPTSTEPPAATGFGYGLSSLTRTFKALTSSILPKPDPFASALCQAATRGDERQIAGLLAQGVSVSSRNEAGDTPLKCAILADKISSVRLLLAAGADGKSGGWSGLPPLFLAASVGSLEAAKLLLQNGASVHQESMSGQAYFVKVVEAGNIQGVAFLLENGAKARTDNLSGQPVIAHAVKSHNLAMTELLLKHGAKVDAASLGGNSLTVIAAQNDDVELLKLLLSRGGDANGWKNSGNPILVDAISNKRLEVVKLLLHHGADATAYDIYANPVLIATIRHTSLPSAYKTEVVALLLKYGAKVNVEDAVWSISALCYAVQLHEADVVGLLLKHGAKQNVRLGSGHTLLSYAIESGRKDLVQVLLENNAKVDEMDGLNRTPLSQAVLKQDVELVKLLVDHGVDVNTEGNVNAVTLAKAMGRRDILEVLGVSPRSNTSSTGGSTPLEGPPGQGPGGTGLEEPPPGYDFVAEKVGPRCS